jgi:hypothetical protein
MAATVVQRGTVASVVAVGSPTITPTFSSGSTAGNLLICVSGFAAQGGHSPAGPSGWTVAVDTSVSATGGYTVHATIWYYPNNPGGITSAAIVGASGGWFLELGAMLMEFTNAAGTLVLDQTGTATDTTSTLSSQTVTTPTVSGTNQLAIAAFNEYFSSSSGKSTLTPSATTGFTQRGQFGSAVKQFTHMSLEDKLDTGTGSTVSATDTIGTTGQAATVGAVATFYVPAAAPSVFPKPVMVSNAVTRAAVR